MDLIIFIIGVWFSILYLYINRSNIDVDIFSPIKLLSFLYLLRNVPYIFFTSFDESFFNERVLRYFNIYKEITLDDAFVNYSIIQTLAFICLIIGIKSVYIKTNEKILEPVIYFDKKVITITIYIAFFIGFGGFLIFLKNVGGINFLLSNLDNRVNLQSGQHTLKLAPLMGISTIFSIILIKLNGFKRKDYVRFVFFLILSVACFSSTGGRKSTLYLMILSFACYSYYVKRFSLKNIKKSRLILVSILMFFYVFLIPVLRSKGGFNSLINGEVGLVETVGLDKFFSTLSYTYIDVFAVNHFDKTNIWNFSSLLTIPSNLLDRKVAQERPPVDEGTYFVTSIVRGGDYKPLIARKKLREFSFPIENMGFAYANALWVGVIIFFFLQGKILALLYRKFINSKLNPFWFYIYIFCVFNFNFSSLRLMNLLTTSFLLLIFFLLYKIIQSLYEN